MITATEEFKNILVDGTEPLYEELYITFSDGTKKTFLDEISPDGSEFADGTGSSSFPVGATVCKTLTFDLDNTDGTLNEKKFYGSRITAYLTYIKEDETKTRIKKGYYTVTDAKGYDDAISVTAMDDMAKANRLYMSGLVLPQTADAVITDICANLGIPMGFAKLKHGTYIVNTIPEKATYREMIGYIAAINCSNARIDVDGYLQMIEWNFSDTDNVRTLIDFEDSPTFSQDDISITGIRVKNGEIEYLYGSSGYVIEIENGLVDEQSIQTVAAWIGDAIIGKSFRSMDGSLICDPLIEFGDIVKSEDRKGTSYLTPITDVTYVHFGATEVYTKVEDPERNESHFYNPSAKTYVDLKNQIQKEKTAREEAIVRLEGQLSGTSGVYYTYINNEAGGKITYIHDKGSLEESTNIIKITSEAIGVSNDGGKTYPFGFTYNGETVTKLLYSVGINADYILSGSFTVTDESGKTIFSADKDTKQVYMDAANVSIGSSTVTKRIEDLQNQADGNIQTWTSSPVPALNNYPASQWITDDERSKHVGDIYYDQNNQAYRFRYDSNGYNWQLLKDTDLAKALKDAQDAKKAAESAESAAALARNVTLQLNNDYATVSVDSNGNYTSFPDITIKPVVMYGSNNITTECIYSIQKSDSISGTWDGTTLVYTVKGLSSDNGWVDIRATYLGTLSVTKRFNISKLYAGQNGLPGKQGIPGIDGKDGVDGKTSYFHIKYSSVQNPSYASQLTDTPSTYIGTYVDFVESNSNDPKKYTWARFEGMQGEKGEQGIPGVGTDGKTTYLHIKYSNDGGKTFTSNNGETVGDYIGTCTDYNQNDPSSVSSYTWAKIKGNPGDSGRTYFVEASSNILKKSSDNTIAPNFIEFKSYYRDGKNPSRTAYNGRFVIEETTDGEKWTTIYKSSSDENTVKHYLYTLLTDSGNSVVTDKNGSTIGIPRDVTAVRCKLYAAGGTVTLLDMQSVAIALDVAALTQEKIVEILSANGLWKGLYYLNGRLYISFDAALGGTLTLGGTNNGNGLLRILDQSGAQVGYVDNSGVNFNKGTFSGSVKASTIEGSTFLSDNRKTATKVESGSVRLRNTSLDTGVWIEDEDTGEMVYIGPTNADWSDSNDYANAGYLQTESRYYPDFASSSIIIDENVATMSLNAFWGLSILAEKALIASFGKNKVSLNGEVITTGGMTLGKDLDVLNKSGTGNGQVHCKKLWTTNLQVDGAKNRMVDTRNYQQQYLNAYETPAPMFGDIGSSELNESGKDIIPINDMLLECINSDIEYQVFLQKEGKGDIWVSEKTKHYFTAEGTPGLKYSWELKAIQRDYEHIRFDDASVIFQESELERIEKELTNVQESELKDLDEQERLLLEELKGETI